MASNVAKTSAHPLPLMDDPSVTETFADTVVGITMNQGNVNITLASIRGDHTQTPPKNYRHVNARVVLPLSAVIELHAVFGQMLKSMEEQGIIKRGPVVSPEHPIIQ